MEEVSQADARVVSEGDLIDLCELEFGQAERPALFTGEREEVDVVVVFADVAFLAILAILVFVRPTQWEAVCSADVWADGVDAARAFLIEEWARPFFVGMFLKDV